MTLLESWTPWSLERTETPPSPHPAEAAAFCSAAWLAFWPPGLQLPCGSADSPLLGTPLVWRSETEAPHEAVEAPCPSSAPGQSAGPRPAAVLGAHPVSRSQLAWTRAQSRLQKAAADPRRSHRQQDAVLLEDYSQNWAGQEPKLQGALLLSSRCAVLPPIWPVKAHLIPKTSSSLGSRSESWCQPPHLVGHPASAVAER